MNTSLLRAGLLAGYFSVSSLWIIKDGLFFNDNEIDQNSDKKEQLLDIHDIEITDVIGQFFLAIIALSLNNNLITREEKAHWEEEKAYHEAGHVLASIYSSDQYLLYATIKKQGRRAGHVQLIPDFEEHLPGNPYNASNHALVHVAGKAAVQVRYGYEYSPQGIGPDMKNAAEHAFNVLYGLSSSFNLSELERDFAVRQMIEDREYQAILLLNRLREQLDLLAGALLERETLSRFEIYDLLGLEDPRPEHSVWEECSPDDFPFSF